MNLKQVAKFRQARHLIKLHPADWGSKSISRSAQHSTARRGTGSPLHCISSLMPRVHFYSPGHGLCWLYSCFMMYNAGWLMRDASLAAGRSCRFAPELCVTGVWFVLCFAIALFFPISRHERGRCIERGGDGWSMPYIKRYVFLKRKRLREENVYWENRRFVSAFMKGLKKWMGKGKERQSIPYFT